MAEKISTDKRDRMIFMPNTSDVRKSSAKSLFELTILSLCFLIIFLFLEYGLHLRHALSVFTAFFVLPFLYLLFRKHRFNEPIGMGKLDRGFIEGVGVYLIFTGYILIYFFIDPEFFRRYDRDGWELLNYLTFTALNVMSVDFFTKRFIQHPLRRNFRPETAIGLQTAVWLGGHYPESLWLNELMGWTGVWVFLVLTGLITGISYERTGNVTGQMAGHVLLNIIITGTAGMFA